ncbi:hypothetical protein [Stenotrophomonas sp.]|uniref:hypothetical protein n=1 Tax=Stenotrophomonas sp. TaxID=69392 RepID=UPI0028A22151|nr:hypothetical protein [Stenotrophomonas sp.]
MTTPDPDHDLLARLRALPQQRTPPAEGWAQLSARLPPREPVPHATTPPPVVVLRRRPLRRAWWPLGAALAAGLAVFAVAPWRPDSGPAPGSLQVQANAMTAQYQQAVASLPAERAPEWQPALQELDRSVVQIRAAMAQDPRAAHLLAQLRRTYALRLELTRQAAQAAAGLTT